MVQGVSDRFAAAPGTLWALALTGGLTAAPVEGRRIRFGRNKPDVDVCLGGDDRKVSRCHGLLICHREQWWVGTVGRLPVRLPGSRMLFTGEDPFPLAPGYTPLFVRGSGRREHLLIAAESAQRRAAAPNVSASRRRLRSASVMVACSMTDASAWRRAAPPRQVSRVTSDSAASSLLRVSV